jgi:hypothetical protein
MAEVTYDTLMDDGNYLGTERARMENQVILDELERKKKARTLAVPTDDGRVRARLREIGEPVTLFGERVSDVTDLRSCVELSGNALGCRPTRPAHSYPLANQCCPGRGWHGC